MKKLDFRIFAYLTIILLLFQTSIVQAHPISTEMEVNFQSSELVVKNTVEKYRSPIHPKEQVNHTPATIQSVIPSVTLETFDCSTVTDVSQIECEALVALYNSANGASWWNSTNWLTSATIADWYGVDVSSGYVSQLYLQSNQLSGTIPPELGSLSNLQYLNLDSNLLSGSIPPQLGSLSSLYEMYLSNNLLSGSIPSELSGLTNIYYLNLYSNELSGAIPESLVSLVNLYDGWGLDLGDNLLNLTGYSQTLLDFLALKDPDWASTQRGGAFTSCSASTFIPEAECNALVALYNSTNGSSWWNNTNWLLDANPDVWSGVTVLDGHVTELSLSWNGLSGTLPPELGNLTSLVNLYLRSNSLTGAIPGELGLLSNLITLDMSSNQLTSIPSQLGNLTSLLNLYLNNNLLTSIPSELGSLSSLQQLYLQSNQLSGTIPHQLGSLSNLQYLYLEYNSLSGNIPLSFVNLRNLWAFHFYTTILCEPGTPEFLAWKATVADWQGTGVICVPPEEFLIYLPLISNGFVGSVHRMPFFPDEEMITNWDPTHEAEYISDIDSFTLYQPRNNGIVVDRTEIIRTQCKQYVISGVRSKPFN